MKLLDEDEDRVEAEKVYKLPATQQLMKDATKKYPEYNDIGSADHEDAIQYVLNQLEMSHDIEVNDGVRAELNDMLSAGFA